MHSRTIAFAAGMLAAGPCKRMKRCGWPDKHSQKSVYFTANAGTAQHCFLGGLPRAVASWRAPGMRCQKARSSTTERRGGERGNKALRGVVLSGNSQLACRPSEEAVMCRCCRRSQSHYKEHCSECVPGRLVLGSTQMFTPDCRPISLMVAPCRPMTRPMRSAGTSMTSRTKSACAPATSNPPLSCSGGAGRMAAHRRAPAEDGGTGAARVLCPATRCAAATRARHRRRMVWMMRSGALPCADGPRGRIHRRRANEA